MRIFTVTFVFYLSTLNLQVGYSQFSRGDIQKVSEFIANLQLPTGALKKAINPSTYHHDTGYFEIIPYFSHIGALGLLYSDTIKKCSIVRKWMTWYVNHLRPNGQIYNYYTNADGSIETTCLNQTFCDTIDAEDSHVALFWILAHKYYTTSKDKTFFTPSVKNKLEAAANYLLTTLWTANNLTLNLPGPNGVLYTMDNSEVYKGFSSLANIERTIYNDSSKSNFYAAKAVLVQTAIKSQLYNSSTGLYDQRLGVRVNPTEWYNNDGITAAMWPELFDVEETNSTRAKKQRSVMNANFTGNKDWTKKMFLDSVEPFTWASIGYLHSKAGDTVKGYEQATYIKDIIKPDCTSTPCIIQDAGWLIINMATRFPPTKQCQLTYNFTGNGNWTKASNWVNSSIPPQILESGSTIYISPASGDSCILDVTQKISRGANLIVSKGATFIILEDVISDSTPALKEFQL